MEVDEEHTLKMDLMSHKTLGLLENVLHKPQYFFDRGGQTSP